MKLEEEEIIFLECIRELKTAPMSIVELMIRTFNEANEIDEGRYDYVLDSLDKCMSEMTRSRLGK